VNDLTIELGRMRLVPSDSPSHMVIFAKYSKNINQLISVGQASIEMATSTSYVQSIDCVKSMKAELNELRTLQLHSKSNVHVDKI
jgi:hypothetical protein